MHEDSLAPHVAGVVRSRRVRGWMYGALATFGGMVFSGGLSAVLWVDHFVKHVALLDTWTGIPHTDTDKGRDEVVGQPSLSVRIEELQKQKAELNAYKQRIQAEWLRDRHDYFQRMVSLTAAMTARSARHRAEAGAQAVRVFELSANCEGEVPTDSNPYPAHIYHCNTSPEEASRKALETSIPSQR